MRAIAVVLLIGVLLGGNAAGVFARDNAQAYSKGFKAAAAPLQVELDKAKAAKPKADAGDVAAKALFKAAIVAAEGRMPAAEYAVATPDDRMAAGQFQVNLGGYLNDISMRQRGAKNMLESGKLDPARVSEFQYYLGNFAYANKDYQTADKAFSSASDYYGNGEFVELRADTKHRVGKSREGVSIIENELRLIRESRRKPPEKLYTRAMTIAYQAKLVEEALRLASELATDYPTDNYLLNLRQMKRWAADLGHNAPFKVARTDTINTLPVKIARLSPVKSPTSNGARPVIVSGSISTESRIALLIGNSNYGSEIGKLANPLNDVAAMALALKSVGFKVEIVKDADQKTIKRAISDFGKSLRLAGPNSTSLFFYAGHGIQSRGINYLIPLGAGIQAESDVDLEAVSADTVLRQMEEAGSSTNIVILDACRNMPLARSFRSGTQGLARMDAPNGSFISYSTAPGSVAADGDGSNSPFVTALVSKISNTNQPIEIVFREVRRSVLEMTDGRQTPWDSSSLVLPFYFLQDRD